jgi:hypothetical protein
MRNHIRTADILRRRSEGETYLVIANAFDLSADRVRQIIHKALLTMCYKQSIEYKNSYMKTGSLMLIEAINCNDGTGISERSRNNLKGAGLLSVSQVREAIEGGELKDINGMGKTSIDEIHKWLQGSPSDRDITQSERTVYLDSLNKD